MQPSLQLQKLTNLLLSGTSHWGERRECLQEMHRLFVTCGALDMWQENSDSKEAVWLEGGYAVSPFSAGMCLFEITRTRLFVQSLIDAINQLLETKQERPLHVLDAGCGPYALLSLLAAQYFTAEEVQFSILDIHPSNMQSAQQLIKNLSLENRFADYIIGDACTYQWPQDKNLHIIIAETMLNGLRKEPQVAVTLHLAPQLCEGGIFIPEKIEVDFVMNDMKMQNKKLQEMAEREDYSMPDYSPFEELLCNVITLSKGSTIKYISRNPIANVIIPAHYQPEYHYLKLYTTITVFGNHIMHHHDSSLTAPIVIAQPNKNPSSRGTEFHFYYRLNEKPEIKFR
jgi:predicted RNA methylase